MAINFGTTGTTYSGGQVSTGLYATTPITGAETFTGSTALATGTAYTIQGSVAAVNDTVTVARSVGGVVNLTTTATYLGYFTSGTSLYYVFSDPSLIGVAGGSFAVSSTGATVSISGGQPITQALPSATCFLTGTGILTPQGEIAVESIRSGDLVAVSRNGTVVFEPVRWVGHGAVPASVGDHAVDDAPVRIVAGAIADNVPHRDLLVTPEHCVHFDGVLIPARMLVNGGSIKSETQFGAFEYYHLELDCHAILIAEGAEAESYLDTGNRANFRNNDVSALQPNFASPEQRNWSADAAAPLAVDRETVEPIWTHLAERARTLGFSIGTAVVENVPDLGLHIVTENGEQILPTLSDGSVFGFVVPAGSGSLRLRSRSARPSDVVGPFVDDRRILGVQVGRIGTSSRSNRSFCTAHLGGELLAGWHMPEAENTRRWTDGDALLPVRATADEPLFLDIELVAAGPYAQVA